MSFFFTPEFEPLMPRYESIAKSALPQLSAQIEELCARSPQPHTFVNEAGIAHYSNLIENIDSSEEEIELALKNTPQAFPGCSSDHTRLIAAPVLARRAVFSNQDLECSYSGDILQSIHCSLVSGMPEGSRVIGEGAKQLVGGQFRCDEVVVGKHLAPPPSRIPPLLNRYSACYDAIGMSGSLRFVAIAAAHHRLMWVHPFLDGNGRLARIHSEWLFYHCANKHPATQNLNREIFKTVDEYRRKLSLADAPRQGSNDGRGALSEKYLIGFCEYFLSVMVRALQY